MPSQLPDYVKSFKPVPMENRIPWFKSTAQTYAGIMLWFVFWQDIPLGRTIEAGSPYSAYIGGMLASGVGVAILGVIIAALICHFCFYLVPGMLGMKTGLPLYIVGTSTYGVRGGFLMPGFFMGILQFGWLGVNAYFSAMLIAMTCGQPANGVVHMAIGIAWIIIAAFIGLKGIKYVASVATFLPIIPFVILLVLFFATVSGLGNFDAQALSDASKAVEIKVTDGTLSPEIALPSFGIIAMIGTYIVGFFATAGAAGADFGMNNRDAKDVQLGGLVGVAGATIFTGVLAILIAAGAHGAGKLTDPAMLNVCQMMDNIVGPTTAKVFWILLALAAFPPACFSSLIAANSFKATLPKVNPFISCGIGAAASAVLVLTHTAGDAAAIFGIIGASFGPICGAMVADYLLAGQKWPGPRSGFNPAGWISWAVGFCIGIDLIPGLAGKIPCPPVAAFIVGFVLYAILVTIGVKTKTLEYDVEA